MSLAYLWLSTIVERERRVRRVAWHEQHSALQRQWLQHLPVRRRSWVFRARVDLLAEWDGAVAQERPQRAGLARTESIERGRVCPPGRRGCSVESRGGYRSSVQANFIVCVAQPSKSLVSSRGPLHCKSLNRQKRARLTGPQPHDSDCRQPWSG